MTQPNALVVRAPGTNCDQETQFAFEMAGAKSECFHINHLLENPDLGKQFQILCIPGGFSYGDDIAAGRIFANQFRLFLSDLIHDFKSNQKLILGICNGFQVLMKSGAFFESDEPTATLTWNESGKYDDRWVDLCSTSSQCVFLNGIEKMYLPIAHAEGRFVPQNDTALAELDQQGQLALRYTAGDCSNGSSSTEPLPFPANPNGSIGNVAGLCDKTGRIFGLMPHPERFVDRTQHPHWTRKKELQRGDGIAIFENAVKFFS